PWPGLVLYAILGRIYVPRRRIEMQERASRRITDVQAQLRMAETSPPLPEHLQPVAHLARRLGDFEVCGGNSIELLTDYAATIDPLIADLDAARDCVNLLFYIFEADDIGQRVADALVRAARRGVECRVLMDAVGSKRGLRRLAPGLRKSGVE